MLGAASPAAPAFAALRPPYWFHDNEAPDHLARFETASGLAIDLPPHGAGAWRSVVVDPMPAGAYELKLKAKATGDQPVQLKIAIEPEGRPQAAPLAATEATISATGSDGVLTVPFTSDGTRSFRVSIEASVDNGASRLIVQPSTQRACGRSWPARPATTSRVLRVSLTNSPSPMPMRVLRLGEGGAALLLEGR